MAFGTLLGHYEIIRRLGQGGMGAVYNAADQKLGRHVAVKLLAHPAGFTKAKGHQSGHQSSRLTAA